MNYLLVIIIMTASPICSRAYHDLTLEDKAGQLFMGFLYGEELDSESEQLISQSRLGNVIYFNWANGLHSKEQVANLSRQVHDYIVKEIGIAPLIAVDQEGGRISRLRSGFTQSPGNEVLGKGEPIEACELGKAMGRELKEVGITLNLAPVVDVNSNPDNPVIGSRTFGSDPDRVTQFAREMMKGMHEGGVKCVLKHFPGHGDTRTDSHLALPSVDKSRADLEEVELKPFKALSGEADAIMTAHLMVPSLDPDQPASLSHKIQTGILRKKWDYRGVVISDSLVMRGVAPQQKTFDEAVESVSRAAIRAFQAGTDCMIIGSLEWADFTPAKEQNRELIRRVVAAFCEAVRQGDISRERFEESVERVLALKRGF